jgi:SAM-dependent methyltransferase
MADATYRDDDRYREMLLRHLDGRPLREILFFVNPRRFGLLEPAIGAILKNPDAKVLNVASGPFALEHYVPGLRAEVHSLDLDEALPALHSEMSEAGLIARSRFTLSDAMSFETDERYDLVVINDLFYTRHVDFYALFEKYRHMVKPGGTLYFDILDRKAGALWKAFNRDSRYRRYDMNSVRETLRTGGFDIEVELPSPGIKGGVDRFARGLLWSLFGIANNVIFKARRSNLAAGLSVLLVVFGIELTVLEVA